VPSLLLQPLVENATKHGIGPRIAPGTVSITAAQRGDRLRVEVINDVPECGDAEEQPGAEDSAGIGLANLRQQLERLYPGRHELQFDLHPGRQARVLIELPYRLASNPGTLATP
jgi:LytS/YehU family sensor histidine kinase